MQKKIFYKLWDYQLRNMRLSTSYYLSRWKNISEDTQETPQSRTTSLLRHQKEERLGTNNDKTNGTYEATDAQRKNCIRKKKKKKKTCRNDGMEIKT